MESIVALDIETTGLDPDKDAVIEIGAVRFKDHRVEGEWSTLMHPGRRIPPFITQLTGITDQMVLQAPSIRDMLPELVEFVGNSPILGHNVRFDLSFLRKQGVLRTTPCWTPTRWPPCWCPTQGATAWARWRRPWECPTRPPTAPWTTPKPPVESTCG